MVYFDIQFCYLSIYKINNLKIILFVPFFSEKYKNNNSVPQIDMYNSLVRSNKASKNMRRAGKNSYCAKIVVLLKSMYVVNI